MKCSLACWCTASVATLRISRSIVGAITQLIRQEQMLLDRRLGCVRAAIDAGALSEQVGMPALLDDRAILDDEDAIGPPDRGEAMRDDQCRATGRQFGERFLDRALGDEHILLHDADLAAQRFRRRVANIDAIYGDRDRARLEPSPPADPARPTDGRLARATLRSRRAGTERKTGSHFGALCSRQGWSRKSAVHPCRFLPSPPPPP